MMKGLSAGLGADVAIETTGATDAFELAVGLARPGGHIATIGAHGTSTKFRTERFWPTDTTISTAFVDTSSISALLRLLLSRQLDVGQLTTHHFTLDEADDAYGVVERAPATGALKVILHA